MVTFVEENHKYLWLQWTQKHKDDSKHCDGDSNSTVIDLLLLVMIAMRNCSDLKNSFTMLDVFSAKECKVMDASDCSTVTD